VKLLRPTRTVSIGLVIGLIFVVSGLWLFFSYNGDQANTLGNARTSFGFVTETKNNSYFKNGTSYLRDFSSIVDIIPNFNDPNNNTLYLHLDITAKVNWTYGIAFISPYIITSESNYTCVQGEQPNALWRFVSFPGGNGSAAYVIYNSTITGRNGFDSESLCQIFTFKNLIYANDHGHYSIDPVLGLVLPIDVIGPVLGKFDPYGLTGQPVLPSLNQTLFYISIPVDASDIQSTPPANTLVPLDISTKPFLPGSHVTEVLYFIPKDESIFLNFNLPSVQASDSLDLNFALLSLGIGVPALTGAAAVYFDKSPKSKENSNSLAVGGPIMAASPEESPLPPPNDKMPDDDKELWELTLSQDNTMLQQFGTAVIGIGALFFAYAEIAYGATSVEGHHEFLLIIIALIGFAASIIVWMNMFGSIQQGKAIRDELRVSKSPATVKLFQRYDKIMRWRDQDGNHWKYYPVKRLEMYFSALVSLAWVTIIATNLGVPLIFTIIIDALLLGVVICHGLLKWHKESPKTPSAVVDSALSSK